MLILIAARSHLWSRIIHPLKYSKIKYFNCVEIRLSAFCNFIFEILRKIDIMSLYSTLLSIKLTFNHNKLKLIIKLVYTNQMNSGKLKRQVLGETLFLLKYLIKIHILEIISIWGVFHLKMSKGAGTDKISPPPSCGLKN